RLWYCSASPCGSIDCGSKPLAKRSVAAATGRAIRQPATRQTAASDDERERSVISILPEEPVPRLVAVSVTVAAGERHEISIPRRILDQPGEGGRSLEDLLEFVASRCADVDRATGVMLAVAGRRTDPQDAIDRLARGDLTPNDVDLPVEAAVGRDDLQADAVF